MTCTHPSEASCVRQPRRDDDVRMDRIGSNARWFVRVFVLPRRTKDSVKPVELFWSSLEQARDQFDSCDTMLSRAFSIHGDIPAVAALQAELGAAGYEHIRPALHAHVVSGAEADGSLVLQPAVARMRLCEARMLAAIQALATNDSRT